jgi:hypothetical protein
VLPSGFVRAGDVALDRCDLAAQGVLAVAVEDVQESKVAACSPVGAVVLEEILLSHWASPCILLLAPSRC